MRVEVSRVSVGGLGSCGRVEESEEVVAKVESGEALEVETKVGVPFALGHYPITLDTTGPCSWNGMM